MHKREVLCGFYMNNMHKQYVHQVFNKVVFSKELVPIQNNFALHDYIFIPTIS